MAVLKNFKFKWNKKNNNVNTELDYKDEIKKGIKQSKLKYRNIMSWSDTKLTAQIEKITNYKIETKFRRWN